MRQTFRCFFCYIDDFLRQKTQVYLFLLPSRSHFLCKKSGDGGDINRCWVFRDVNEEICKPKFVIYKPYWRFRGLRVTLKGKLHNHCQQGEV